MANRLRVLIAHDARMQFQYGIYFAYAFVIAFYVLILIYAEPYVPAWLPAFVIFTDPAVVGFFFLGALMMLEKSENTRNAIAITPVSASEYFAAKSATLTTMALVAISVLFPFLHEDANWVMLLAIVALVSVQFLAVGIPVALHFETVTSYLMGAAGFVTPVIMLGFLALMDPMPNWAILIPSASQFKLILIAVGSDSSSTTETVAMFTVTAVTTFGAVWFAIICLKKELGNK